MRKSQGRGTFIIPSNIKIQLSRSRLTTGHCNGLRILCLPDTLAHQYVELRKAEPGDTAEAVLVKAPDKLEALLWAYEEYLLGNKHVSNAKIVEDILLKLDRIQLRSVQAIVTETRKNMRTTNDQ